MTETVAWPKGSMVFQIPETKIMIGEKFVSQKDEPPSSFIRRILKKSKNINGASVWAYLEHELRDDYE